MNDPSVRGLLRLSGIVAMVFGTVGVTRGILDVRTRHGATATDELTDGGLTVPRSWLASVDSEFRFYAAWYAASGAAAMHVAGRPQLAPSAVGAVGTIWVTAGLGRLLSTRVWGRPHALYRALTGVELLVGSVLLARAVPRLRSTIADTVAHPRLLRADPAAVPAQSEPESSSP